MTRTAWPTKTAIWVGVGLFCLLQIIPFYVAITTALKPKTDLSSRLLPPTSPTWENFATAIQDGGILRAIANSAIITLIATVAVVLLGAITSYPLARRESGVNKGILFGIVGIMMVPPLSVLVPLYTMMANAGGVNTYWGISIILVAQQLPLAVFLYVNFVRSLPVSLEEAARIDGANLGQIVSRIVFPLLKPVTATVVILTSVAVWNEFAMSVYMLTDPAMKTIAPSVSAFFSVQSSNLGAAAAGSLLAVLPILVVYLFLQRYFIKGMVAGAEK